MPAELLDQDVADRRKQELAEGAGRGAGAEGHRPPVSGRSLPKAPSTRLKEQPERPKPISTPAPRWSSRGVVGIGHDDEAGGVEQRADAEHAHRAETVGDGAGEGRAEAPEQVLDRDGEPEGVAAPAELGRSSGSGTGPAVARGPKVISAIRQPARTMISGETAAGGGGSLHAAARLSAAGGAHSPRRGARPQRAFAVIASDHRWPHGWQLAAGGLVRSAPVSACRRRGGRSRPSSSAARPGGLT